MDGNDMICGFCGDKMSSSDIDSIILHMIPNHKFKSSYVQELYVHYSCLENHLNSIVPTLNPNEQAD